MWHMRIAKPRRGDRRPVRPDRACEKRGAEKEKPRHAGRGFRRLPTDGEPDVRPRQVATPSVSRAAPDLNRLSIALRRSWRGAVDEAIERLPVLVGVQLALRLKLMGQI